MRSLSVFNQVSLDGYFCDSKGDISWAHQSDPEWDAFTAENAKSGGALIFGRKTYDMMVSFWPTRAAKEQMPEVAEGMNRMPKIVFSRTLKEAKWDNTKVISSDIVDATRKMKEENGPDLMILGSGTIVSQLSQAGLIDEYKIVVNPIVLGQGRTLFERMERRMDLELKSTRRFRNGRVVLIYGLRSEKD